MGSGDQMAKFGVVAIIVWNIHKKNKYKKVANLRGIKISNKFPTIKNLKKIDIFVHHTAFHILKKSSRKVKKCRGALGAILESLHFHFIAFPFCSAFPSSRVSRFFHFMALHDGSDAP